MDTIAKFIRKHFESMSDSEIAEALNKANKSTRFTANAIEHRRLRLGLKKQKQEVVSPTIETTMKSRREREERRGDKSALNLALKKIDELEKEKEALFALKRTPQTLYIKPSGGNMTKSVAVVVASDWHVEETVLSEQVNGMNEYNPDIAKSRAEKFWSNTLRLLNIYKAYSVIDTLIVAALGDFISNTIHEELAEGNSMMPGDALWFAKALIQSGIDYLLKSTDVNIVLVCHTGNHGRMTKKVHVSTESGNSLERYMYRHLAENYKSERRVRFIIAEGMQTYLDVLGTTVRFLHGHSIQYQGGIGGIHIPVRKAISQWDKVKKADLTVMGHFHQAIDGGYYIVNGSLIGYNAFGQFIKADYEKPRQMFFLIHEGRGKTGSNYVWLD